MNAITVAGTNLFAVALDVLGDATQWTEIAALNRMLDPMIDELTTLRIPSARPAGLGRRYGNQS